ncbi:MAG: DegT/DnrJ/EryC1/StrS family aminotransferase [Pirellulaceae bacterium]
MKTNLTRRGFVRAAAAGSAALAAVGLHRTPTARAAAVDKPALLGGNVVHKGGWPQWPEWRQSWEARILEILRSGRWYRGRGGGSIAEFETGYAELLGAKRCLGTASGTTALITSLQVMGLDAGDEVIVSPYTFIATYNAILMHKALPVFADTDPATLNMDPSTIESRITERTRLILPVHIYGIPCDMDPINAIARKHGLGVVEDACQAWLAEYKGRNCGTLANLGCFSFQNSKHIPSGEGGAIVGNSDELIDRCCAFHNCGRATGTFQGRGCFTRGTNFRMQHYQAAMLVQQFDKLVKETAIRQNNADHLIAQLQDIPGIAPAQLPEDSRAVWHLFPLRYDSRQFHGLSRDDFIRALRAEGIPCGGGYREQYFDGLLDEAITSRGFKRLFPAKRLKEYRDSLRDLQGNRQVCATTVGLSQKLFLADRGDIDHIAEAIRKIHAHSAELA